MSSGAFGIRPKNRYENPNSIPLRVLKINASIKESLASVELKQTFMNLNTSPLECEYSFPIKEECVITSLIIQFSDGSKMKAEIEEESKAQEMYQDSISSGQTAVFAKSKANKITFNIGNIQPNDTICVELSFCFPLQTKWDKWIFTLDNYIFPHSEEEKFGSTEEVKSNVKGCNYYVDFNLEIFSENSVSDFSCEQFKFNIFLSEDSKHLTAKIKENSEITPDKSVEISYKTSDANIPKCMIQEHEGEYTAMLSFLPIYQEENEDLEDLEGSGEYIFILDRSGSMSGKRIEMAKESLALLLKSLPQKSKFNIISFGTDFVCMHPISVEYSQATLDNSLSQLKLFRSDLESTNIYGPLNYIYKTQALNDYPRVIFLITDGDVENPEQVINLIQKNSSTSRVHTFGIGSEVSKDLVKNAAKAGGGISAFINNKSEINQKVIAALQKCIMPALTDWTVNWNEEITPSAQRLSTVYYGERFILYSNLGQSLPNLSPILSCFDTKINARREFSINYSNEIGYGEEIRKLWAKNKIEDLEEARGNKAKIIEISMKYQVLSPYTAFIAKHINLNPSTEEIKFTKIKKSDEDFDIQVSWKTANPNPIPANISRTCTSYKISPSHQLPISPPITNHGLMGINTVTQYIIPCNLPEPEYPELSILNTNCPPPPPLPQTPPPLPPRSQMFPPSQSMMTEIHKGNSSIKSCPPPPPLPNGPPPSISSSHSFQPTFLSNIQANCPIPPPLPKTPPPLPPRSQMFPPSQSMMTEIRKNYSSIKSCPPPPPLPNGPPPPISSSYQPKPSFSSNQMQKPPSPSYQIPTLSPSLSVSSKNIPYYSPISQSYSPASPSRENSQTTPSYCLFDLPIKIMRGKQKNDANKASFTIDNSEKIGKFSSSQKLDAKYKEPAKKAKQEIMHQKLKMVNYMKLVEIQAFDGSWANSAIFELLEFSPEINEEISKISLENFIGTLIALAYLNKYCLEQKAEWGLIERKALRWLKQNHASKNLIDLIIEKI